MPASFRNNVTGSGSAMSERKSQRPAASTLSMSSFAMTRIADSSPARDLADSGWLSGVRYAVCRGGSSEMGNRFKPGCESACSPEPGEILLL